MTYKFKMTVLLLSLTGLFAYGQTNPNIKLQSGDILFREKSTENISEAIDKVTQTSAETHFSHMGIAEINIAGVFVLHASPDGGSCRISLNRFLHPKGDSVRVVAYRLNKEWQQTIPSAIKRAHQMLGKPYNFSYVMSDTTHYCSEFVYLAFAADSVFKLDPMTFKDPESGNFFPTWVEYYQKLGIQIPEGKPGCNPNGMAASDKLERLREIK